YAERSRRAARSRNDVVGGGAAWGATLRRAKGYNSCASSSPDSSREPGSLASSEFNTLSNVVGTEGFCCDAGRWVEERMRLQMPCSESDANGRFPVTVS